MEAFGLQKADPEEDVLKMDFRRFIKTIEFNSEKTLLNRKNQVQLRQKIKQDWLNRSKIIPPSFPAFQRQSSTPVISINPYSFHHTKRHLHDFPIFHKHQNLTPPRSACNITYRTLRNAASCQRVRSNWKLEFRRDELNILKYTKSRDEKNFESQSSIKPTFKVRKINRKFEELKFEVNSLYRTNLTIELEKQNCRERLKTTKNISEPRIRYLA